MTPVVVLTQVLISVAETVGFLIIFNNIKLLSTGQLLFPVPVIVRYTYPLFISSLLGLYTEFTSVGSVNEPGS